MKKNFLILTLCFTIIFTSVNYKKSYADGGVISLPILATVSSLAVVTGITLSGNDDLYDLGKSFYDYVKQKNDLTWETLKATFNSSVVLLNNNLVSVDTPFLDIVKDFFNSTFGESTSDVFIGETTSSGMPLQVLNVPFKELKGTYNSSTLSVEGGYVVGDMRFIMTNPVIGETTSFYIIQNSTNKLMRSAQTSISSKAEYFNYKITKVYDGKVYYATTHFNGIKYSESNFTSNISSLFGSLVSIPYQGGYTWDNVENKKENDSISLPIPGNLGQLVGQGSSDFWDNTDNLVGNGDLSIPSVDNPSIGIDDAISFPTVGDVPSDTPSDIPSDTPFSNITEYIIGLVVPSDSYWTDTFGGLQSNFISSFPMVNMDSFNSLSVNGKPFPNIDIKIMGSKGRVVNGDTVNSIVNWLRPIIAGFVFLCLMFFNYRKLYKLIRNSEPFEGIGKVENHAN